MSHKIWDVSDDICKGCVHWYGELSQYSGRVIKDCRAYCVPHSEEERQVREGKPCACEQLRQSLFSQPNDLSQSITLPAEEPPTKLITGIKSSSKPLTIEDRILEANSQYLRLHEHDPSLNRTVVIEKLKSLSRDLTKLGLIGVATKMFSRAWELEYSKYLGNTPISNIITENIVLDKLSNLQKDDSDPERSEASAVKLLCEFLRVLGYSAIIEEFEKIRQVSIY